MSLLNKCPGFRVAKVTLHPGLIREQAFPSLTDEKSLRPFAPL